MRVFRILELILDKGKPMKITTTILILVLLTIACGRSYSRSLLVYTPHGVDMMEEFKRLFEATHPGVEVRYVDMGSQEILDRVRLEKMNPQADIWWGASAITFDTAAEEELLEAYRPTWTTRVEESWRDPQDRWYATYQTPEVIVYNTIALKPEEAPQDWDECLDPKWKGKVIIRDPLRSDTMRTIFSAMMLRQLVASGSEEQGYEWLRRLDSNTKEYTADGVFLLQKLARQEGLITLWNLPDTELNIRLKNLPLGYRIPRSGSPAVIDCIAIVKGTREPELAREFYEFVTSDEKLILAAEKFYRIPLRNGLQKQQLPEWLRGLDLVPMELDRKTIKQKATGWMQYWDTQIRNQKGSS